MLFEEEAEADRLLDADQWRRRRLMSERLRLSLLGVVNSEMSLFGSIEDEWWFPRLRLLERDRRYVRSVSLSSLKSFSSSSSSSLLFSLHEKLSNAENS